MNVTTSPFRLSRSAQGSGGRVELRRTWEPRGEAYPILGGLLKKAQEPDGEMMVFILASE